MLSFRPHHFLCTLSYQGAGYNAEFIANYDRIATQLQQNPDTFITVTHTTDSICAPCPYNKGYGLCHSQAKVVALDQAHTKVHGISPGETLTWRQAKERIRQKLTLNKFEKACQKCEWFSLGICRGALSAFLHQEEV